MCDLGAQHHSQMDKIGSRFWGGRKPEYPEKTLEVRLRSTETQSLYNIYSGGGRRDWCSLRQPDFPFLPCPRRRFVNSIIIEMKRLYHRTFHSKRMTLLQSTSFPGCFGKSLETRLSFCGRGPGRAAFFKRKTFMAHKNQETNLCNISGL